jgi:hypothetical protein
MVACGWSSAKRCEETTVTVISDLLRYRFTEAARRNLAKPPVNDERHAAAAALLEKLAATADALDAAAGREINELFGLMHASGQRVLADTLDQVGFSLFPADATDFARYLADKLKALLAVPAR